ncbi:hypothetical protein [Achromobacter spanius]|uniref:hypothetical protein n=1 Tax=Achromobacter spanius TaxID=217203 RepID=UPI001319D6F8|nr:hypothetical protein [Achromobacter spanius]
MFVALTVPALANAGGGVIGFIGAVVEPAVCTPRVTPASPGGLPRVACAPDYRGRALQPALRVRTSVREVPAPANADARGSGKRYVVTLDYL